VYSTLFFLPWRALLLFGVSIQCDPSGTMGFTCLYFGYFCVLPSYIRTYALCHFNALLVFRGPFVSCGWEKWNKRIRGIVYFFLFLKKNMLISYVTRRKCGFGLKSGLTKCLVLVPSSCASAVLNIYYSAHVC
jgi:hypothetical protein